MNGPPRRQFLGLILALGAGMLLSGCEAKTVAQLDSRPEVHLQMPGAFVLWAVDRPEVRGIDEHDAADREARYSSTEAPSTVESWYGNQLSHLGWRYNGSGRDGTFGGSDFTWVKSGDTFRVRFIAPPYDVERPQLDKSLYFEADLMLALSP